MEVIDFVTNLRFPNLFDDLWFKASLREITKHVVTYSYTATDYHMELGE